MPQPEQTADATSASHNNLRVAQAIRAYCQFPHPQRFALMVDGPWGSGKTHLTKALMDELAEQNPLEPLRKPLYVSLYGVEDAGEIGDQIYQQLHPVLGHRYSRLLGAVARGALKGALKIDLGSNHHADAALTTQVPELKLSDLSAGASQRVVIFDDFERAAMTPTELLGFINPLVEHDGCKVVILANESEVDATDAYLRRKEKTVGLTLRQKADGQSALQAFLPQMQSDGARDYLRSVELEILAVFKDSELDNLRLLQRFIWSFEQFWSSLTPRQRAHGEAMREMTTLLCAATLELRSGRTAPAMFKRIDMIHFVSIRDKTAGPDAIAADAMFKRYSTVNFESMLLALETVREIVLDAAFPLQAIKEQLQGHPYFEQPKDIPSWRALWHSSKLQEAELSSVLERFKSDFDSRAFRTAGEVMHVAGLCLWLSDIGQPGWEAEGVMGRLKSYVSDAFAYNDKQEGVTLSSLDRMAGGAFGLGFVNNEDQRMREIADWIDTAAEARRRMRYPAVAAELHRAMSENSEAFRNDVCFTSVGPSRYARSAVLACIPAAAFAETFVSIARHDQEQVAMALSLRYDQVPGEPELRSELPWLFEVVGEVERLAAGLPPIPRHHLNRLIHHHSVSMSNNHPNHPIA